MRTVATWTGRRARDTVTAGKDRRRKPSAPHPQAALRVRARPITQIAQRRGRLALRRCVVEILDMLRTWTETMMGSGVSDGAGSLASEN